ncbi:MAG: M48 family metalloprotease [Planctomycetota bacterium]
MHALTTMFVAVLLWSVAPEFDFALPSWSTKIFPSENLLVPLLLLLLLPALGTIILLLLPRSKNHLQRLSSASKRATVFSLVAWFVVIYGADWIHLTRSRTPSDWHGIATLFAFLPFIAGIGLSSMTIGWWSRQRRVAELFAESWDHCRPSVILLIPLFLMSSIEDWILHHPDQILAWPASPEFVLTGFYLSIAILGLPYLLGWMISSRPMPAGQNLDRFLELSRKSGIRCGVPRIWNTGSQPLLNAMITGLLPFQRQIYITDQLLKISTNDELDSIFAHELAHARQRHLWIYLLTGIGFILALLLLDEIYSESDGIAALTSILIVFGIFFGRLSRQMEHQADLVSDELTQQPGSIAQALAHISTFGSGLNQRGGWRHPGILTRIQVIHQYREDPIFRKQFQNYSRRLLLLSIVLVSFCGVTLLFNSSKEPQQSPWEQKLTRGISFVHAAFDLQTRSDRNIQRESELLLGAENWLQQGVEELRQQDPGHQSLPGTYRTLAIVYDLLDQPWDATACRLLARFSENQLIPDN